MHANRLLLIARAIGEPADDAVQEAFIRLAVQKSVPDDPLAWLVRVTRNQLLQWHRSGKRREVRQQALQAQRNWFTCVDLDSQLDAVEVTVALQQLPAELREVVVMHLWGELSFEQIASLTSISRSAAHRRYTAAVEELRRQFSLSTKEDRV